MDIISEVISLLYEEGMEVNYAGIDLDLREYITDSIQFISFIVGVEEKFDIEFPDEYLRYDSISSLHSFVELIRNCKDEMLKAHND